jgi:hypothetical protein
MLAVGSHCESSPRTLRNLPTPLLSGIKTKGTYLVLMMMVNWRVVAATNVLYVKYIKPTALNWDGACLQVAEDASSSKMAILLPTDIFHLLDGPWIHISTMQESVHWKDWWQFWRLMWSFCKTWPAIQLHRAQALVLITAARTQPTILTQSPTSTLIASL